MNTLTNTLTALADLMLAHPLITGLMYLALAGVTLLQYECTRMSRLVHEDGIAYWEALYARIDAEAEARRGVPEKTWSFMVDSRAEIAKARDDARREASRVVFHTSNHDNW